MPYVLAKDLNHSCLFSLSNTSLSFQFLTCGVALCSKAPVKDRANKSGLPEGRKGNKKIQAATDYCPVAPHTFLLIFRTSTAVLANLQAIYEQHREVPRSFEHMTFCY